MPRSNFDTFRKWKKCSTLVPCRLTGALAISTFAQPKKKKTRRRFFWYSNFPCDCQVPYIWLGSTGCQLLLHLDVSRTTHCIVNLLEVAEKVGNKLSTNPGCASPPMRTLHLEAPTNPSSVYKKLSFQWNLITNQPKKLQLLKDNICSLNVYKPVFLHFFNHKTTVLYDRT